MSESGAKLAQVCLDPVSLVLPLYHGALQMCSNYLIFLVLNFSPFGLCWQNMLATLPEVRCFSTNRVIGGNPNFQIHAVLRLMCEAPQDEVI